MTRVIRIGLPLILLGLVSGCKIAEADCSDLDPACSAPGALLVAAGTGLFESVVLPVTGGLAVWLRADAGITESTTSFLWADLSGNGNNVEQTTSANQPVFESNKLNGLPALLFTTNQTLTGSISSFNGGDPSVSIFMVYQTLSSSTIAALGIGSTGTNSSIGMGWNSVTGNNFFQWGDADSNSGGTVGEWSIRGALREPLTTMTSRLNGNSATSSVPSAATIASTFYIGRSGNDGTPLNFSGYIAEVIVYDVLLSESDAALVECYLNSRYGITVSHTCG